jgi:hypothetical protein
MCASTAAVGSVPDNTTQDVIGCFASTGPGPGCSLECYNVAL